jgi:hypothetical protein
MGLPARQRRMLDRIEGTLRGSDPKLAALYSIFARLTRDEEIPRIEQLRHSAMAGLLRLRRRIAVCVAIAAGRLVPKQRAVLFFPLALALAAASIIFAARSSSGPGCAQVTQLAAGHTQDSKLCKNPPTLMGFGH